MTGSVFHAVAPVSAVCAAFAAQPNAYPPSTRKSDVAPPCGNVGKTLVQSERGKREKRPNSQNRGILNAAAKKQEKAKVSCAHLGRHICPQCGQFGTFGQGLLRGQKQPCWGRKRR